MLNIITDKTSLQIQHGCAAGDELLWGKYPQRGPEDSSPVEWIVLYAENDRALLISRYCLITSGYCDIGRAQEDPSCLEWGKSLAREQFRAFYDTAFSGKERASLLPKLTEDPLASDAASRDFVFLLSEAEVTKFLLLPEQRKGIPTPLALAKEARLGWTDDTRDCTGWWLLPEMDYWEGRRPSCVRYPKAVFEDDEIQFHGRKHCPFRFHHSSMDNWRERQRLCQAYPERQIVGRVYNGRLQQC